MDRADVRGHEFDDLIDLKTSEAPSYLTEYVEASILLDKSMPEAGDFADGVDRILNYRDKAPLFETTRVGRFHRYVVDEFISWWLATGGFRRFGYASYRGFMGGTFTDPSNLPFRSVR